MCFFNMYRRCGVRCYYYGSFDKNIIWKNFEQLNCGFFYYQFEIAESNEKCDTHSSLNTFFWKIIELASASKLKWKINGNIYDDDYDDDDYEINKFVRFHTYQMVSAEN